METGQACNASSIYYTSVQDSDSFTEKKQKKGNVASLVQKPKPAKQTVPI